jgi:hypothetical protein
MENKQLTVADMASIKSLLEAAMSRGTFKPAEYLAVGVVYDKLCYFVEQSQAQLEQQNLNQQQAQGEQNA